jgi:hypothetical protein
MPTKKAKQDARMVKRAAAKQRDLQEMRAKLAVEAEGAPVPELPSASVRFRKSLKNRTEL